MVSTRRNKYNQASQGDEQEGHEHPLVERRRRWSTLLRTHHYQPVIAEVLAGELLKYSNSTLTLPTSLSSTIQECVLILASAPLIFAAAVDGTLAGRFLTDSDLRHEYAAIQERAHIQPSIYIHLLVDEQGVAPTANQYLAIRDVVLRYISAHPQRQDTELAWLIDNVSSPAVARSASASGHRKYLWTRHRSPQHEATLLRFCHGILERWTQTPQSQRDVPFAYPPGECGYSINSHIRLAQHRHRQSSNYVMNLTEDICSYLHASKQFTQLFRMHQFIIYLIFRPQQAAIAEIFCSGLLQVWIEDGGGFNAYPAGRSVASATRVSHVEWKTHEEWASKHTRLIENVRLQRERLENDVLELEKEMEELWREALEDEAGGDGDDVKDLDYVPEAGGEED
ncbi:hypothetical protein BU26DRAFT_521895 [Trematosphaeria pertusa]|uniref:Uncharacterized protein n=1 Tax=Trematosphaeria pertusa TaxID=390896 RepID=A0A6A6I7D6_9PLEO|nr:uncharacterized protein BU26DRAFT_521895 [Trematosphaeria pertusa]KAF2245453.1 hypothetical protein BU26DRAFT_521895 [Trematosphaeria pertusa]